MLSRVMGCWFAESRMQAFRERLQLESHLFAGSADSSCVSNHIAVP